MSRHKFHDQNIDPKYNRNSRVEIEKSQMKGGFSREFRVHTTPYAKKTPLSRNTKGKGKAVE